MARNSTYGESYGEEVRKACISIIGNTGNISPEELDVLKFLATKGSFEDRKVIFAKKK